MGTFRRHDLVCLASWARRGMLVQVLGGEGAWPKDEVRRLVTDGYDGVMVPGIVRRQEERAKGLCIGLSSPYRCDGMRLRVSASVPRSGVTLVRDPYQVAGLATLDGHRPLPAFAALRACMRAARERQMVCGVFGSAALELVTGLPYCHETSDVDVLVPYRDLDATLRFHEALLDVEERLGIRVDAELELADGFAVKLKEFCSDSGSVLAKGFNDVRLFSKEEAVVMNHR